MKIDFSIITIYEVIALFLSLVAILIPIIQWAWKKFIMQPELRHYPTGHARLFINKSGSYIQFPGVFEALKKPISVRNIDLKIVRKKDDNALNLSWSVFNSPVNQQIVGAYTSTMEIAHPFRIDADNMMCAFIEFSDFYNSSGKILQPYFDKLLAVVKNMKLQEKDYQMAYREFVLLDEYKETKNKMEQELFWTIGKYEMLLEVKYNTKATKFQYNFNVSKENAEELEHNIEETIAVILKQFYGIPLECKAVQVQIQS